MQKPENGTVAMDSTPRPSWLTTMAHLLFRGGKFQIVAWMGTVVNQGLLYILKGLLGVPLIAASILAIEISIVHNFLWNRYWTWHDRSHPPLLRHLFTYNVATGLVDLVSNVSILWFLTTFLGIHYLIANLAGMLAGPFIKFWLNERWLFR